MADLTAVLSAFHWIRPWWLLAIPVVAVIWWLVRRRDRAGSLAGALNLPEHLLDALTVNRSRAEGLRPIDLIMVTFMIVALAAAGPAWQRIPNPFFSETAPLVVAVELTDTMLANDVAPTRLERARLKLLDLMGLRAGGRTAVVAFAGSAHLVLPPSEDPAIVKPFLEGLEPDIMPRPGVNGMAAVRLAHNLLDREDTPGSILLMTDGLDATDVSALRRYQQSPEARGVVLLAFGTEAGGFAQRADGSAVTDRGGRRIDTGLDVARLDRFAGIPGVRVIRATADNSDLDRVQRVVQTNLQNALDENANAAWNDRGWLLAWPAALLMVFWFRRGWTMQWGFLLAVSLVSAANMPPAAADPVDWFLTPDQQGRLAFENKRFEEAAERFENPLWKGLAAYRAGRYAEAVEAFARVPSDVGFYNLGNAHMKARDYARAVEAYRLALAENPGFEAAQRNLVVAEYVIVYLNDLRLASDTQDESELGADGFKFDNTVDEGVEIVIDDASRLEASSEEQWMRAVDTESAEFLRIKFAVEADAAEPAPREQP